MGTNIDDINLSKQKLNRLIEKPSNNIISEPVLVFSDVHGNFSALQMAIEYSNELGISKYISLGDLIDYNPYNNEVLELIKTNKNNFISLIKGNHDRINVKNNEFKSSFFDFLIEPKLGKMLLDLPEIDIIKINNQKILLCHSNPYSFDPLYLFDNGQKFNNSLFEFFFSSIANINGFFFGHTHYLTYYEFKEKKQFAFNPGSLGVSRDGNPRLTFGHLFPSGKIVIYQIEHEEVNLTKLIDKKPIFVKSYQILR